jgi:hypothetical protein
MTLTSREHAVWIGAIWHAIDVRELWKAWGYDFFYRCIEEEQDRGYSTVMECIVNYRYFVIESRMDFEEYLQLMRNHGRRKVSCIRRDSLSTKGTAAGETDGATMRLADSPTRPRESTLEEIRQVAERMAPMTVEEAKRAVSNLPQVGGDMVYIKCRLTKEEYALYKEALNHIQKRAKRPISWDRALGFLVSEYCSTVGVCPPIGDKEAA